VNHKERGNHTVLRIVTGCMRVWKFTILRRHVEVVSLFNKFFSDCRYMPQLRRCSPTKLRLVFSASRVQHISGMHSKFALRPHHVRKYGRQPISDRWD